MLDAVLLLRIQFGVAIGLHYLFPSATIGLAMCIVVFETLAYVKKDRQLRAISSFLVKVFTPLFVVGVATGLLMPFMFGLGWSRFSSVYGEVFGSFLAIESITAFTVESVFLAILVFGRDRVKPGLYLFSAVMVLLGTHLSVYFIVAANSWLQTPAGYALEGGRVVLTSLSQALFNPSALMRFIHTMLSAWMTGAAISGALAAWLLLRRQACETARRMLNITLVMLLVLPITQLLVGHAHIMDVLHFQPAKSPAYEGIFTSTTGAPLYLFGIPDSKDQTIRFGLKVPFLLSILESGRFDSHVVGLEAFPPEQWPPVDVVFTTFHIMVGLGFVLIGIGLAGGLLMLLKRVHRTRWFLWVLVVSVPFPFIAAELGWITAEIGRQPWLVYGVLKTTDAVNTGVSAGQVLWTLLGLGVVYAILLTMLTLVMRRVIAEGPGEDAEERVKRELEAAADQTGVKGGVEWSSH